MANWNEILWGQVLPGGGTGVGGGLGGIDINQVIDNELPDLHAASRADLVYWTTGDLIQWLDESLKRLALRTGVFITRVVGLTVGAGATYNAPPQHLSTRHLSFNGLVLRPASTKELEGKDEQYLTRSGTPDHWYPDLLGMDMIGLYPIPAAPGTLANIYDSWPPTLDAGGQQTLVPGPAPLKGYLAMALLGEAYGRESEIEMPDVAQHCRGRLDLYYQVFESYYGKGV